MKKILASSLGFIVLILFALACASTDQKYQTAPKKLVAATSNSQANTLPVDASVSIPTPSPTISMANPDKKKTATVISENANLRETANSSGEVIEEVAEGTEVEIIKQTGAWFKVRAEGKDGWLHGNTIRLSETQARNSKEPASEPPTVIFVQPTPPPVRAAEAANPSGATARCRDGSLSYSAHRQGTCSHHGGVSEWLNSPAPAAVYRPPASSAPSSSSGYIRGPRGGCYTYTSGGNKRYVDRSLCN